MEAVTLLVIVLKLWLDGFINLSLLYTQNAELYLSFQVAGLCLHWNSIYLPNIFSSKAEKVILTRQ